MVKQWQGFKEQVIYDCGIKKLQCMEADLEKRVERLEKLHIYGGIALGLVLVVYLIKRYWDGF